jgi:hydrogenase large subunit
MPKKIVIDPVTRIEGHLKVELEVDGGKITDARTSGTLFRGIEIIMKGRDPRDAQLITQRICGVCPMAHATASTLCLDNAFGVTPAANGRIMRNLMFASNYIQSHILHFYHLTALDYVKGPDAAPFIPRYEGDYRFDQKTNDELVGHYIKALEMRRKAHEMLAIFGGKMPHQPAIVPGGVTGIPTQEAIDRFAAYLKDIKAFVDGVYIPDVLAVAKTYPDYFAIGAGCKNLLAYGAFDIDSNPDYTQRKRFIPMGRVSGGKLEAVDPSKITEQVKYSRFKSGSDLNPSVGATDPEPEKPGAYTWLKAPRYGGAVYEVGPLARVMVSVLKGDNKQIADLAVNVLSQFNAKADVMFSVLGRHASRAIELKVITDAMPGWLGELKPGAPAWAECKVPDSGAGMGLTEGARGALGHWINIKGGKTENYQAVVPTTWNASPMDDKDQHGPMEQALIGAPLKDADNPFEAVRIVRSFDPCLACAIHIVDPKGRELSKFRIG